MLSIIYIIGCTVQTPISATCDNSYLFCLFSHRIVLTLKIRYGSLYETWVYHCILYKHFKNVPMSKLLVQFNSWNDNIVPPKPHLPKTKYKILCILYKRICKTLLKDRVWEVNDDTSLNLANAYFLMCTFLKWKKTWFISVIFNGKPP